MTVVRFPGGEKISESQIGNLPYITYSSLEKAVVGEILKEIADLHSKIDSQGCEINQLKAELAHKDLP